MWFDWFFKKQKQQEIVTVKTKEYWDTKHPTVNQVYQGRPIPGTDTMIDIDVRHFCWERDILLNQALQTARLIGATNDETAGNIQKFVVKSIKYVDDATMGSGEFWLFPNETLMRGKGDCEDGAILIASLLLCALPPEEKWRVRVAAGFVQAAPTAPQGGHGYCTYCRTTDNEWVVLDWCYMEDSNVKVSAKPLQKDNPPYKDIWFSFNHEKAWSHIKFEMIGRIKNGNNI